MTEGRFYHEMRSDLMSGKRITRGIWMKEEPDSYIRWWHPSSDPEFSIRELGNSDGTWCPFVVKKHDCKIMPYTPSAEDLMMNDWVIFEKK